MAGEKQDERAETGDPETITLEESDQENFDDMLSETSGYFDPPVENYRFLENI